MRGRIALALTALLVAGCYTGPSANHYTAVLDELKVPAGWETLDTKVHGPGPDAAIKCSPITDSECPSVIRFYSVGADAKAALASGRAAVAAAGFRLERELGGSCTPVSGSAYCAFESVRDKERLFVAVYGSTDSAGIPDAHAPGLVVVVTAKA